MTSPTEQRAWRETEQCAWLELLGVVQLSMMDLSIRSYARTGDSSFEVELYDLDNARHFEVGGPELGPLARELLDLYSK